MSAAGRVAEACFELRTADRLEHAIEQVRQAVRGSTQVAGGETDWRGACLHAFFGLSAKRYEADATRSIGPVNRFGIDWSGIFRLNGWETYEQFLSAIHHQYFPYLLPRCDSLIEFRNRFRRGERSTYGLKVMAVRLSGQEWDLVRHPKTHAPNERFAKFLKNRLEDPFTVFLHPRAGVVSN